MKITNKAGIPDSLFRYLSQDLYDYQNKADSYSATELLNPVQIIVLRRRHWENIEIDAIDQTWKLLGSGVHAILEKEKGIEKIERLKWKVMDKEVSGRWDRIFNNEITDFKVTSAWTVTYGSRVEEWKMQLSIYRWLYYKVKQKLLNDTGYIDALLRDWTGKNLDRSNYPKANAVQIPIELCDLEDTEEFITNKIKLIIKAEKMTDTQLLSCTDSERWYNKEKRIYNRCNKYCDVSAFCQQLKREKEIESIEDAEELFV